MADELLEPDPSRTIESLRDTGYSFNTAIADIVDNSIAANATVVKIDVRLLPADDIQPIVTISDNGCGMDNDGLLNAMKYGSRRRTDPNSLGKFGLGLKTASTAFCRKLSVVSRGTSDSTVRKYQWDLDYVSQIGKWMVRGLESTDDEIDMLNAAAGEGSGTLVIWENVDRMLQRDYVNRGSALNALERMRKDLRFHLGVVFQRFIDKSFTKAANVEIILNGEPVEAWDPFCLGEPNTELLTRTEPYKIRSETGDEAQIDLKAYAIPRADGFSCKEAREKARISTDTLGFYIYRENRLIHYGDWLGMFKVEPHDSLLRVEFSFDNKLDTYFNIDIKKSRVQLVEGLYDYIKDQFLPAPKRHAQQKYRTGQDKKIAATAAQVHAEANKTIDEHAPDVESAKITVVDAGKNIVEVQNKNGTFNHTIVIEPSTTPDQCRVIPKEDLPGGALWAPCIADQKHAVQINTRHDYYQKIYLPLQSRKDAVIGMDSLLWALAEAEHGTYNERVKEVYEDIRLQVSTALRKLIKDLPEPEIPDTNEEVDS
jgi:hypothetical protein